MASGSWLRAMIVKTCSKCQESKTVDLFPADRNCKDGYRNDCKKCVKDRTTKWREKK